MYNWFAADILLGRCLILAKAVNLVRALEEIRVGDQSSLYLPSVQSHPVKACINHKQGLHYLLETQFQVTPTILSRRYGI